MMFVECPCCLGDGDHGDIDRPGCSECNSSGVVTTEKADKWQQQVAGRR